MGPVIFQLFLMVLNLGCVVWMYELENYKVAIFNGFAAGVCFMGMLDAISNLLAA